MVEEEVDDVRRCGGVDASGSGDVLLNDARPAGLKSGAEDCCALMSRRSDVVVEASYDAPLEGDITSELLPGERIMLTE